MQLTKRFTLLTVGFLLLTLPALAQRYGGGDGDGHNSTTGTGFLAGYNSRILYGGGTGDGHTRSRARATPSGFNYASMYRGSSGEGSSQQTYAGRMALPLTLISFGASPQNDYVLLKWVTEHEEAVDYFTIERRVGGQSFTDLARTPATGFTASGQRTDYELADPAPPQGTLYYRLRTTDFDGTFSHSQIVGLQPSDPTQGDFAIYPNPTEGRSLTVLPDATVRTDRALSISIVTSRGRLLYRHVVGRPAPDVPIELSLPEQLDAGSYLVQLQQDGVSERSKLLIVVR